MKQIPDKQTDDSSLDDAFRLSIQSVQAVSEETNKAEAKIMGIFATASAIVGISAAVSTSLIGTRLYFPNLLFYMAVIAYIWVIVWTYIGLKLQTFYLPPDPKILKEHYWNLPKIEFMQNICQFAGMHYQEHVQNLKVKTRSLYMVLPGLVIEVLLLLTWAFLRVAFPIS